MDWFLPDSIRDKMTAKYKSSSIKTMDRQIKRIHKIAGLPTFSVELLMDLNKVTKIITELKTTETVKKSLVNTTMKIIEFAGQGVAEEYKSWFKQLCAQEREARQYAKSTLKEQSCLNDVDIDYLVKKRNEWKQISKKSRKQKDYIKYLVLSLYTMLPPLRGEDYFNTRVLSSAGRDINELAKTLDYNFYDLDTKTIVITKYKTSSTYGIRTIVFPEELASIISQWMNDINPTNYLIPDRKGNMMRQQSFTDMLFRIFKPYKISTSMLRKIYISKVAILLPVEERKEISKIMAHSLVTQEFIYNKSHQ